MDKLSVEILSIIFCHLHYQQKQQCKLVCRHWAQVLRSNGLEFESVKFLRCVCSYYTSRPYRVFIKDAPNKTGCRRLVLGPFYDRAKLANLLPNLKFLAFLPNGYDFSLAPNLKNDVNADVDDANYFIDPTTGKPRHYTDDKIPQFASWHRGLETLIDLSFTSALLTLLETGIFHGLTTLVLCKTFHTFDIAYDMMDVLFDKLKNTPNLKLLELGECRIKINNLEKLHSNLPCLETLRLPKSSPIDVLDTALQQIHSKAISIKNLDLGVFRFGPKYPSELLEYVLEKYPKLQEFRFRVRDSDNSFVWKGDFFSRFLHVAKDTLTRLEIDVPIDVPNITTLLQETPLFSLATLKFKFFNILEKSVFQSQQEEEGLKNQVHDLIDFVENSNIKSFSLVNVPSIKLNVFKKLNKLKELRLMFCCKPKYTVELNVAINELPKTLETLALSGIHVYLKKDEDSFISGITRLELLDCQVKCDLSDYLSNQLPQLSVLILQANIMMFNLRLHHSYLSLVDIFVNQGNRKKAVKGFSQNIFIVNPFKVTVGNKTRIYLPPKRTNHSMVTNSFFQEDLINIHDHAMHYLVSLSNTPLGEDEPCFHFHCNRVQTLLCDSKLILI